ncbi:MAG: hypothetical protein M3N32_07810 [Actinomycetota bacterium]|nr:hypothetical protein [Actinomycetota bacterium]
MSTDRQRAYIVLIIGAVLTVAFITMAGVIIGYQQSLLNLERRLLQEQAEHRCRKEQLMLGLYEAHKAVPPPDFDPNPTNCSQVYYQSMRGVR